MFGLMLQKMWHKKWMNISLLLGCTLLIATVVCFPIYREAAYDRMLNDAFESYIADNGKLPTKITGNVSVRKERGGETLKKMDDFPGYFYDLFSMDEVDTFTYVNIQATGMSSETKRTDAQEISVKLSAVDRLSEKTRVLVGDMYSETGYTDDGAIECVVSQNCLVNCGLLVDEYFTFDSLVYSDGKPVRVYIKGVIDASDDAGYFWVSKPDSYTDSLFCNPAVFRDRFTGENAYKYTLSETVSVMFDCLSIKARDVDKLLKNTDYLYNESSYKSVIKEAPYMNILDEYSIRVARISATLVILQVPVLAMLVTFLFMISGQMYEMEKNEISVIKSRGSSKAQIIRLYFYQGTLISVAGGIIGLLLGRVFAKVLGATRNFLEFNFEEMLDVAYTPETFIYLLCAILLCILSITIPSIKHSSVSIVNLKQSKAIKRKAWWEKLFLDVIFIGVSLYGFYSFKKNGAGLSNDVMAGESLDPLLYLSSSVFILGAGLFFLRMQPYIVKLIYTIGKKGWGPASHVSFLENIKNGRKQQLIMLFLIMTISLGMYHATVARTILDNAVENTEYLAGADVVIKERWSVVVDQFGAGTGEYVIPNYAKYNTLQGVDRFTRVIYDSNASTSSASGDRITTSLIGIHTKEFGQETMVNREYLEKHYYEYLNDLAACENGMLVTKNFATKLGYKEGDSLIVTNVKKKTMTGKIVGFIDYFPGYSPIENGLNPDGTAYSDDVYLVVTHFDLVNSKWGTTPYEVWIDTNEDFSEEALSEWILDNKVTLTKYSNKAEKLEKTMQDPLLQGTNGVLTMGFVVTLILCAVGYLIFWIMSIRERELMFGVLRATGLHKSEIIKMLINEQIFSGFFSVIAGIGIGKITSTLYVPILQQAYASEKQALPMKLITNATDMYRLYGVIAFVMIAVLMVLIAILSKMNVTKALKLGEE